MGLKFVVGKNVANVGMAAITNNELSMSNSVVVKINFSKWFSKFGGHDGSLPCLSYIIQRWILWVKVKFKKPQVSMVMGGSHWFLPSFCE